jgi:hypothetical protein
MFEDLNVWMFECLCPSIAGLKTGIEYRRPFCPGFYGVRYSEAGIQKLTVKMVRFLCPVPAKNTILILD